MNAKAFFHWQWSGVLIPLFYGLGLGFWGLAVATDPMIPLFSAAALLLFCGLVWTLGWLCTHDFFLVGIDELTGRKRKGLHTRERKLKRLALFAFSLLIVMVSLLLERWLWTSYKARAQEKELGTVEVYFNEGRMMPGFEVPYFDPTSFHEELLRVRDKVPAVNLRYDSSREAITSIMVKNTSEVTIRNPTITIDGNQPFDVKTGGCGKFSDTEWRCESRQLVPFTYLSEMEYFSVTVPMGVTLYSVTVYGDNMTPYAAFGKVNLVSTATPQ